MNGTTKIHSRHLDRQAIVYLRQSSTKQVQLNQESARNQRALSDRLLELGWNAAQISVVDEDQGKSAAQSAGREGFQKLAADVGLGRVGIIVGYEVSRLSRNCADWHQLLELCAVFDTLIGDVDGIYHPRDFNDRLLLGLKGTMSAAELHSLRLRLDAGRLSKARRGELVQHLPTGLVRTPESVILDPDESIQQRIRLVFEKFRELSSIRQVMLYFLQHKLQLPRRQTSGLYAGQVLWKDPSAAALGSILKNPAYAGAFAYGRRRAVPTRKIPGRPATGRIRQQQSDWITLLHDVYPAYISWQVYEENQQTISRNADRMKKQCRPRSTPGKALLVGLVRCGKCGLRMSVIYKERNGRYQYCCQSAQKHYGKRSCQFLSAQEIETAVADTFFQALRPAEIDALEQHSRQQADRHHQLVREQTRDVQRLEYAAHRAEQQYDNVDPTNRLIAATLESKWEAALHAVNSARERLEDTRRECEVPPVLHGIRQWPETGLARRLLDEPAVRSEHRQLDSESVRVVALRCAGRGVDSRSDRYALVAPLRQPSHRSSLSPRPPQVRRSRELRALPKCRRRIPPAAMWTGSSEPALGKLIYNPVQSCCTAGRYPRSTILHNAVWRSPSFDRNERRNADVHQRRRRSGHR